MVLYTALREKTTENPEAANEDPNNANGRTGINKDHDDAMKDILKQVIQPPQYVSDRTRDDNPLSSMFFPFFRRISRKDIKEIVEEILIERDTKGK